VQRPFVTRSDLDRFESQGRSMPFDNIVSRPDADPLIPEDVAGEAIAAATRRSAALTLFRRVSMGSKLTRVPVLSALPVAYRVNGDSGLKGGHGPAAQHSQPRRHKFDQRISEGS
jgi:hypothetical protein